MATFRKGGKFRYIFEGIEDGDSFVLPAGCRIDKIITDKTGATASNFNVGTTDKDGEEMVAAVSIGSAGLLLHTIVTGMNTLSLTSDATIYFGLSAPCTVNVSVLMTMIK